MIFNASKPITDALINEIEDNYDTYLQLIAEANDYELKSIETIKLGTDYQAKGLEKPAILIDPRRMSVEDTLIGEVAAGYVFDVIFCYDGYSEEDAATAVQMYADAFTSMVISDDYFQGNLEHATVNDVEYYPGGSALARYAVLELELILEIER